MRDNGLPAQEWTHVADLDPRVADAALDALRTAGVAAYATPHPGHAGPYLDVQLPDRPTDRLYVEAGARERAAAVLADLQRATSIGAPPGGETGEGGFEARSAAEVDARFAEIVSQFDLSTAPQEALPPPAEPPADDPRDRPGSGGRLLRGTYGWDDLLASGAAEAAPEPEDEDEGYVPPPPPAVPRGTPLRRFAWAAVLGAPIVVILCVLFSYGLDGWAGLLVVGAFIGGLVTLVATLDDRPPDDGPDHGAVV